MECLLGARLLAAVEPSDAVGTADPQKVLIESAILEVTTSGRKAAHPPPGQPHETSESKSGLGLLAAAQPMSVSSARSKNAAGGQPGRFGYAAKTSHDFEVLLAELGRDPRVKILQRPRIQTADGIPATLFVGEMRPLPRPGEGSGAGSAGPAMAQVPIGVTLEICPRTEADRLLTMDLRLRIDRVEGDGRVPVTSSREARSTIKVGDGETALLAGLAGWEKKGRPSGLRFPKELPGAGNADFRSAARLPSELMILVRPRLLRG
jgi:type II secretory pathway component GspD/PulD (secretin)